MGNLLCEESEWPGHAEAEMICSRLEVVPGVGQAWSLFPNWTAPSGEPGRVPERDAGDIEYGVVAWEFGIKRGTVQQDRPRSAMALLFFFCVFLAETFDPTGSIHQLLLTGVERMT